MLNKKLITSTLISLFLSSASLAIAAPNQIKSSEEKTNVSNSKKTENNFWFDYKRGLFVAGKENKYVMLNFYVKDNPFCQKLESTFSLPEINKILEQKFIGVKIDGLSNNMLTLNNRKIFEKDLIKEYKVEGYPTIIFLDSTGNVIGGIIKGSVSPDKFLQVLKYISSDSYKDVKFKDYLKNTPKNKEKETE